MILYYREDTGDYLAIDTATNAYYRQNFGQDHFESRATAIAQQVGSLCTTAVSRDYLKARCRRVVRTKVPEKWQKAIGNRLVIFSARDERRERQVTKIRP